MMRWFCFLTMALLLSAAHAEPVRLKDLGKLSGARDNALTGYGLVTGLAGTGDSARNKATRQSIANMLSRFDMTVVADDVQSRNAAAVMVTASLPPYARSGDTLDVTVTSLGDARSLVGGTLILAPLKGPDGQIYALAQGALSVGGYKYDLNGNVVQKNHPTVASIPAGATVEVALPGGPAGNPRLLFLLAEPDHTTATRAAQAINARVGQAVAVAEDAAGIALRLPDERTGSVNDFMALIENVLVEPDRRAKVVINERTGTIVSGGDVRIAKVVVSQGDLKVNISTDYSVAQPLVLGGVAPGVRTALVANSQIEVSESGSAGVVVPPGQTVADLVQALARIKTSTRDIISVLRAVKAAGALHAELIVQ